MYDRNLIRADEIPALCAWLTLANVQHRAGKGAHQLLQVKTSAGWQAICFDQKGNTSTPPALASLLNAFGNRFNVSPVLPNSPPRAPDTFLQDLRDDFAMAALTGLLGGMWFGHKDKQPIDAARAAYAFADAMIEARKQ